MSKFCTYCGKEIEDGVKFCPFCGKASNRTAQPKQEQAEQTAPPEQEQAQKPSPQAQSVQQRAARVDERSLPAKDLAVRYCGNWMALVFAILLTLDIIFNIIDAINTLNTSDYIWGTVSLLFIIGEIICCIGCWITYADAACHHTRASGLSVIGAGLLVPLILFSVFFGLICLVLIIYIILMISAADELSSFSFLPTDLVGITLSAIMIFFAIVVLIAVLTICTCVGLRRTTASGGAVLSGRRGKWDVSMFALVMLIILAAMNFLLLLFAMALAGTVSGTALLVLEFLSDLFLGTGVFSFLSYVLNLAVYVFAIIILFRIRHAFAMRSPVASASDGR